MKKLILTALLFITSLIGISQAIFTSTDVETFRFDTISKKSKYINTIADSIVITLSDTLVKFDYTRNISKSKTFTYDNEGGRVYKQGKSIMYVYNMLTEPYKQPYIFVITMLNNKVYSLSYIGEDGILYIFVGIKQTQFRSLRS